MITLITGMSGTGKSTLIAALAARGHAAVDLDAPAYSEYRPTPAGWHSRGGDIARLPRLDHDLREVLPLQVAHFGAALRKPERLLVAKHEVDHFLARRAGLIHGRRELAVS